MLGGQTSEVGARSEESPGAGLCQNALVNPHTLKNHLLDLHAQF
jgi:hypothetical protein